ncbi:GIY-YIG nuclease family protein [Rathayibacter festucae]|uniref:GIY-YIG nuclease family protein n=1 Tax=Rathayibacter festucae TaxID=110937 RepID=UPI001FB53FC7|nr:GIY-YIG nuclease family protein [Rathayibacter festucae]MCJ1701440.1 GIY-YIG nuclease family protein [Rathayibacter festucae]
MTDGRLAPLSFTRYDMSEAGSAATIFTDRTLLCGIYVLEFENGQRYVGQTRNIVSRYATHRRHHGDVIALSFASCRQADLDDYEVLEIRRQEASHRLRNLALTGWPGGEDVLGVTVEEGKSILLPWEREKRGRVGEEGASTLPARFWELARRSDYDEMSAVLARYVCETIADPFGTQFALWTISALPSTKRTKTRRRLLTLSCGILETVFAQVEREVLLIVVNVDAETLDRLAEAESEEQPGVFEDGYDAGYKSAEVAQYVFESWQDFSTALDYSPFVEAAYKLNTTMMRRGGSPLRRHHNTFFANDLLRIAASRTE